MNYLLCSVGRRGELVKYFKQTISSSSVVVATDNSQYAPALYLADKQYIVPRIDDPDYINVLLGICAKEKISAVMTFIDPEIEILAHHRNQFAAIGVEVLVPYENTARLCYDKFELYKYLKQSGIKTVETWGSMESFDSALSLHNVNFPVFVKPRTGSGSVGARKIECYEELVSAIKSDPSLIIQEYMNCIDLDADVYIDLISHQAVSAFSKHKIETRIGGANKTVSFKDPKLFDFIRKISGVMDFYGPIDMDFFYREGEYYLSEINPRFGGAYLHAYGAGINFIKLIENNLMGVENPAVFGDYDCGVVMMMYDSVVICKAEEIVKE